MEPNIQSVRKCIHQKFLPIGEHPAQEGVLEPSCGHITPLYNFGWCLPMEEIDQYYPECEWDMANYWPKHVRVPWAKEFRNKYLSKEQPGFGYSPYLDFFFLKKKPGVDKSILSKYAMNSWNVINSKTRTFNLTSSPRAVDAMNPLLKQYSLSSSSISVGPVDISSPSFLYLGVFSGPVEGILILVVIYMITGLHGPSFWDTPILDFLHLSHIPLITNTFPNIGLNVSFMVAWLSHPELSSTTSRPGGGGVFKIHSPSFLPPNSPTPSPELSTIRNSALFIPFLCAWGLQFAHQVGRMILAHLTKTSFPVWDWLWVLSLVGAVDANLPRIAGTSPIIQSTPFLTALYVYTEVRR
ncbi:choline ethanolaminephosphotransferase [Lentinula edodes]|uniref:Choline ethanolaminephosphotransferase n=1 Tax=Lentinula edodes TaxID=5353 RepID=A0A1Q3EBP1_LENED|nr:choline ethanolaminephosphotransferase [Lentinula edodes]